MSPTLITSLFGSILRVGRTSTPPMGTPNGIAELKPVELNGAGQANPSDRVPIPIP